jgi:hypothetical protein
VRKEIEANAIEVCEEERTRAACVFLPATDVGPLYVYDSVLIGRDGKTYESSLTNQKEDWRQIRTQEPGASFCFAGDLNQELSNSAVKNQPNNQRLRKALKDSYLTCLTAEITYSFEDTPDEHKLSIDHICVSQSLTSSAPAFLIPDEFRECSFRIPKDSVAKERTGRWYTAKNEPLSDHHGVVATVSSAYRPSRPQLTRTIEEGSPTDRNGMGTPIATGASFTDGSFELLIPRSAIGVTIPGSALSMKVEISIASTAAPSISPPGRNP